MRFAKLFLIGLGLSYAAAMAQDAPKKAPEKSVRILEKAQAALKGLITSIYRAQFVVTGSLATEIPSLEGRGVLGRRTASGQQRFRAELTLHPPGGEDALEYTIGSDGEVYFAMDRRIMVVYTNTNKEVLGTYAKDWMRMIMSVYSDPDPFAKELEAETVYLGEEQVGDEECHKLRVKAKNAPDVIWYISKSDWIPRKRVEVHSNNGVPSGTTELTITFFIANPRWSTPNMFKPPTDSSHSRLTVFAP